MFGRLSYCALIIFTFILVMNTYRDLRDVNRKIMSGNVVIRGSSNIFRTNDNSLSLSGGGSIFSWMTRKKKINKSVHITNGNTGNQGKGITCIYWNKGPSFLKNKQEEIKQIIQDHKPHILGLGEANLKNCHDLEEVKIQGYNIHADSAIACTELGNTARVVVYTHELVRVKRRHDLECNDVSAIWMECGLPHQKSVIICMAYRQWRLLGQSGVNSSSVSEQLARWSKFLLKWEAAILEGKEVIVMLDANLDHLTWGQTDNLHSSHSSVRLRELIDLLFAKIIPLGVSQLVNVATRYESGQPASGLDHVYANRPEKLSPVQTYFTGLSDHKMLKVVRYAKSFKHLPRYVRKRIFKDFDDNVFIEKLSNSNFEKILECDDVNNAVNIFNSKLSNILDTLAPVKTIQVRTNYVPGLSKETKQLQVERSLAQQKASYTKDPDDWRLYRVLRNRTTSSVRQDKIKWEKQKFSLLENTSSDVWRSVKGWLGWTSGGPPLQLFYEGRLVTRPAELAYSMNSFFISKIKSLREKIPYTRSDPLKYMKDAMSARNCTFKLDLVTLTDVKKLIMGLKNSNATGVDYLNTRTIKLGVHVLAPAICHIINLSISSKTFPDQWKWHKVVPLLKSSNCDKMMPNSYRPVALLPVVSKVLEKAVFNQLVEYLEKNGLIHPNLHGSRAGHSTATALMQLCDAWLEEVEIGNLVGVLLCDQSAAFDLCDHSLLLEKLKLMGVDGTTSEWFASYLSNRRQSCMIDGQLSTPMKIPQCGVPQGSIGGPILWLIFTCDQPDVTHTHPINIQDSNRGCVGVTARQNSKVSVIQECGVMVGYVDDGAYSFSSSSPETLSAVLSEKYRLLADWMNANKLVSNADKTHLMVMGSRRHKNSRQNISIMADGFSIKPSATQRLLGVFLHQDLSWKQHLRDHKSSLLNQLTQRLNGLRKVCINAAFPARLMLANGVIMSRLTYLITLWGGASKNLIKSLQVQQLAAARIVCGYQSQRWSKRQILDKVSWLSVRQLIFYFTVVQTCKTLSTGVPKALHGALSSEYGRSTRNAIAGNIKQSGRSTATFQYRAAEFYNSVPTEVRSGSVSAVKAKLRKWIKTNIPID